MGRFAITGRTETPWTLDGDRGFKGIYMPRVSTGEDRSAVPPGYLARNENRRIVDGASCTRPGANPPGDFNPAYANPLVGSHIFNNPNGDQVMLVATASATYVWALQFGKDPVQIPIDVTDPDGTCGTFLVQFVQAFDKVMMFRIMPGVPPLMWDGNNANKFMPVTTAPTAPFTIIPNVWAGIPFYNRLLLYEPYNYFVPWRNQFIASDTLQPNQYDAVNFVFRVNAAVSDVITSLAPFLNGTLVVFMRNSIQMFANFTVDPSLLTQRQLNDRLGSAGVYGPLLDGTDYIFLSQSGLGFYRLSEVDQAVIASDPLPISHNIQPIIDRIDWTRAPLYHSSAKLGRRAYFTLPLDHNSGACDFMVVYDMPTREWESIDYFEDPAVRINRLQVTLYDNQQRVFALDYAASKVYLLEDGVDDRTNNNSWPIHDRLATRGFDDGNPAGWKRFQRAIIAIRSYDPSATVTAVSDGVNETKDLGTITKDHTKFYVHGHADFDPVLGDPTEPKRQDYADTPPNVAIEDFEDLPVGTIGFIPPSSTIFTGVMQQSLERPQIRQNGRWVSIEIENTRGKLDVLGCGVDGTPAQEGLTTVA